MGIDIIGKKFKELFFKLTILNGLTIFLFLTAVVSIRVLSNYQWLYKSIFSQTQQVLEDNAQKMVLGETTDIEYTDARVLALEQFFTRYDSPLLPYAEKIVNLSDKYDYHYGLLPAIAMVESGLCRKIPDNSYNCWGWGIYGKNVTRFVSFDEAIETVAAGIKRDYIDRGFTTPESIMLKYNPSNHNDWLGGVNFFLDKLE